jgi:hypothetical protein
MWIWMPLRKEGNMVGYEVKCKFPYDYTKILESVVNCIQLTEPHEAGEIINDHWLIVNCYFDEFKGKYEAGEYVKVVDIRYFDIIASDMNLENIKGLKKINTEKKRYATNSNSYEFDVNIYQNISM